MQHAGDADILHVGEAPGDLVGNILASHRLADHGEFRRLDERCLVVAGKAEALVPDQCRIADPARRIGAQANGAVGRLDLAGWHLELRGAEAQQLPPRGGGGATDLHAARLDPLAAAGRALVGRQRGVAGDDVDRLDRHCELLGRHLAQGRRQALAEIDLAAEQGNAPIPADRDEAVDRAGRQRPRRSEGQPGRRRRAAGGCGHPGESEADDEGAGALQEFPARGPGMMRRDGEDHGTSYARLISP